MSGSGISNEQKGRRNPERTRRAPGSGVHKRAGQSFADAKPVRVLLVEAAADDERDDAMSVTFEADGFEVETVGSGAAALELLLVDGKFGLVVCAARMSDVTACEFLENLSWVVPGERPPVVVFGQSNPAESLRTIEGGALHCLPEDCGPKTLARELVLLLQSGLVRPFDESKGARSRASSAKPAPRDGTRAR